jgi:ABC-type polar amino acid transport system ATPase subunit
MTEDCVNVQCCDLQVCIGDATIIRDVTFTCCSGEWVVLTSASGADKATLLRAINGLCPPTPGRVWALSSWLPGRSRREARRARRRTGAMMQDLALFEAQSALVNVSLAAKTAGRSRAEATAGARLWLERVGLGDKSQAYPRGLSGGERQLAPRPQLLILDEPTAHLDNGAARIVLAAVKDLVNDGAAVVMASHRSEAAEPFPTCRITPDFGKILRLCA